MSFNIKCDETIAELPEEQKWDNRKNGLVTEIFSIKADLIGMQEVMPNQQKFLADNLGTLYNSVYQDRQPGATNSEGCAIYYNKNKFKILESGTFWLSETPNVVGSTSWNSRWPRICTFAILQDKQTQKIFSFFNTHLDHKSAEARVNGIKLIVSKILKLNIPGLLTGDFNCGNLEETVKFCNEKLVSANALNIDERTFHLFGNIEVLKPELKTIDYIYVHNFTPKNYKVLNDVCCALKNSDHYAITAEIEPENKLPKY